MIEPLPCVVLAKPDNENDPSLTCTEEGFALSGVLKELVRARLVSEACISTPASTSKSLLERFQGWPARVIISDHEHPQKRLLQCMDSHGWERILVLTSYSVLLDAACIEEAAKLATSGEADAVYPEDVTAPKFFIVMNRKAVASLSSTFANPLPPFVFPAKLKKDPRVVLKRLEGQEPLWEKFLWELLFAGGCNNVPAEILAQFHIRFKGKERQDRLSCQDFIASYYSLRDTAALEQALLAMAPYDTSLRLAMHINNARKLCAHLPSRRTHALEIGHGKAPVTALAMCSAFDRVDGADVYNHNPKGVLDSFRFLATLEKLGLDVLPQADMSRELDDSLQRAVFHHGKISDVALESNSVDFCYSRMVLEHVEDMDELASYLARVMRPGGVMLHEIGLQDHQDLSHINFEFLRHSQEEWAGMNKGTNLLRLCDFVEKFQKAGFLVRVLERDVRKVPPETLHPTWKDYSEEDLYCYRGTLHACRC